MKKVLALSLCLIPLLGLSQNFKLLDSLTLVKFGSSRSAVVAAVKANHGVWDVQQSVPQYYVFTHIRFDGRSKSLVIVRFTGGRAHEIDYVLDPDPNVNVLCYYCEVIQKISEVYGPPKSGKQFKSPCKAGATEEVKAIKLGNAYYGSCWYASGNSILLTIDAGLHLTLVIQDNKLTNAAFEKRGSD